MELAEIGEEIEEFFAGFIGDHDAVGEDVRLVGFKNLIQIASCLDSQSALTGSPLTGFTDKFRGAALRKTEGAVYIYQRYPRDEFLNSDSQTPHFVSQGTGREQLRFKGTQEDVKFGILIAPFRSALSVKIRGTKNELRLMQEAVSCEVGKYLPNLRVVVNRLTYALLQHRGRAV